jgi:tetratricopeptide (TPR) repeat protein
MTRRILYAVLAMGIAVGASNVPAVAGQDVLGDAQVDYNAGRYNRAVDGLTGAIAKSPNDAASYFLLGESYYQLREYARAIEVLEHAVQLDPKKSEYHDWLGKSYGRRAEESVFFTAIGWARKTHKEFETAVQLDSGNLMAERDLIRFEMNAPGVVGGGDEKALKHIDDLEKIDPVEGELARGEFFITKKKMTEADGVFAKIMESNSDHIGVYFEAADYFRDRQDGAKMGEAISDAKRIDPNDRRLKFYKGIYLVLNGKNSSEAEKLLKSYLDTVPDHSDLPPHAIAMEWLGKLYESEKKYSEAAEEYRASLALDPHNKAVEEELKRVQGK